ncbi:hypothetical protein B0T10DRAFT_608607 [Thelonectria olida]|uniref:Uncharacterized protein n=1 Tax=Thelonectria olida TaxID=1576542 RepID=A0A9P8W1U0_9HYPO|nr:hypothetical protein B0T10DRAFT_608607 [Thelonectria olida]
MSDGMRNRIAPAGGAETTETSAQPAETISKSDVMSLGALLVWQVFNMVNMGTILSEWKGWAQETRSSKGWIIAGTFQTIVTLVVTIACTRVWLQVRKSDKRKD